MCSKPLPLIIVFSCISCAVSSLACSGHYDCLPGEYCAAGLFKGVPYNGCYAKQYCAQDLDAIDGVCLREAPNCSSTDGFGKSSAYPCACGSAICAKGELCEIFSHDPAADSFSTCRVQARQVSPKIKPFGSVVVNDGWEVDVNQAWNSSYIGCFIENSSAAYRQNQPQWCSSMTDCKCPSKYAYVGYTGSIGQQAEWSCFHHLPSTAASGCGSIGSWYVGAPGLITSIYHNPTYQANNRRLQALPSLVTLDHSCVPQTWLGIKNLDDDGQNCASIVASRSDCNSDYFNWASGAHGGDGNCGCVTNLAEGWCEQSSNQRSHGLGGKIRIMRSQQACVDISGSFTSTSGSSFVVLTQNGCSGTVDDSWSYTVAGNTATMLNGATGTISGSSGSYTIVWSDGITYRQTSRKQWCVVIGKEQPTVYIDVEPARLALNNDAGASGKVERMVCEMTNGVAGDPHMVLAANGATQHYSSRTAGHWNAFWFDKTSINTMRSKCDSDPMCSGVPSSQYFLVAAGEKCNNIAKTLPTASNSSMCANSVKADPDCGLLFEQSSSNNKRCSCLAPGAVCLQQSDDTVTRYQLQTTCNAGTYSTDGILNCKQCPAGKWNNETGMSICNKCSAGKWNDETGAKDLSACKSCPAGKWNNETGMSICNKCSAGKWNDETGAKDLSACKSCPAGKWMETRGASACTNCIAGKWSAARGATQIHACKNCSAGRWSDAQGATAKNSCMPCGAGRYSALEGSSKEINCAGCPPGTWNDQEGTNSQKSCRKCSPGKWSASKAAENEGMCVECSTGMTSQISGSITKNDCYCKKGSYYVDFSGSCNQCNPEGMICAGGLVGNRSGAHQRPIAQKDWYMLSVDYAEPCAIMVDDYSTVCLGNVSFENQRAGCIEGHTGPLCAACEREWTRDAGGQKCRPCSQLPSSLILVAQLNLDLILKASFGLFVTKSAIDGLTSRRKLDAVLLRIFMQFTTVMSVLLEFDYARVKVFTWSQERIKEARNMMLGEQVANETLEEQHDEGHTRISTNFRWPPEFRQAYGIVFTFAGDMPGVGSNQESLECLVVRLTSGNTFLKYFLPAIFWLLYPVFVLSYTCILSVLLAKIVYPIRSRAIWKVRKQLSSRLRDFGADEGVANEAVESIDASTLWEVQRQSWLRQKGKTPSLAQINNLFGFDVTAQIVAERIANLAPGKKMPFRQRCTAAQFEENDEQKELTISVLSASGLRNADLILRKSNPYCTIEIQDRSGVLAQTTVKYDTVNPEWNEDISVQNYVVGQSIVFTVRDRHLSEANDHLGTATVSSYQFFPGGSKVLCLRLAEAGEGIDAALKVRITVRDDALSADKTLELDDVALKSRMIDVLATTFDPNKLEKVPEYDEDNPEAFASYVLESLCEKLPQDDADDSEGEARQDEAGHKIIQTDEGGKTEEGIAQVTNTRADFAPQVDSKRSVDSRATRSDSTRRRFAIQKRSRSIDGYQIFGLFRNARICNILKDLWPVVLITVYSIWTTTTRRYLAMLQTQSIYDINVMERVLRWKQDLRIGAYSDAHQAVSLVGYLGLGFWSFGFCIAVASACRVANLHCKLQDGPTKRLLGYFYDGIEPRYYWWELLVKRMDVFLVYIVTYDFRFGDIGFELEDPKAKLILYLAITAIFWVAHSTYMPYDKRRTSLADRLEYTALQTRFSTLFLLCFLLILDAPAFVNKLMAALIISWNLFFVIANLLAIVSEMLGNIELEEQDAVFKNLVQKIVAVAGSLERQRQKLTKQAPRFVWQGRGSDVLLVDFSESEQLKWRRLPRLACQRLARILYMLTNDHQRTHSSKILGEMLDHLITRGGFNQFPSDIMDFVFVLPIALKKIAEDDKIGVIPATSVVAQTIRKIFREADRMNPIIDFAMMDTSDHSGENLQAHRYFKNETEYRFSLSPEDLAAGLLYLQSLSKESLGLLVATSMRVPRKWAKMLLDARKRVSELNEKINLLEKQPASASIRSPQQRFDCRVQWNNSNVDCREAPRGTKISL